MSLEEEMGTGGIPRADQKDRGKFAIYEPGRQAQKESTLLTPGLQKRETTHFPCLSPWLCLWHLVTGPNTAAILGFVATFLLGNGSLCWPSCYRPDALKATTSCSHPA